MWGTSSHSDKLTGDFGNAFEVISIGDCGSFHLLAGKLSPRDLGLLQQNQTRADMPETGAKGKKIKARVAAQFIIAK